jgi:hypothetical protein
MRKRMKVGDRVKLKPVWDSSAKGKIIQKTVLYTIELDEADAQGLKTYVAYEREVEPE